MNVGERIHELEALVRSLLQQQQTQQTPTVAPNAPPLDLSTRYPVHSLPDGSPQSVHVNFEDTAPRVPAEVDSGSTATFSKDRAISHVPLEDRIMRMHSYGASYVSSVHWAAVLDSISELKDHYQKDEDARLLATSDQIPCDSSGPRLLYEPVRATKDDILVSVPDRPVVDRMVARYFNAQGVAPGTYNVFSSVIL